jgi:hypothetical protein
MKVVFPDSPDFAARIRAGTIVSGADADEEKHEIEIDESGDLSDDDGGDLFGKTGSKKLKGFDPDEPRDEGGRWTNGGGDGDGTGEGTTATPLVSSVNFSSKQMEALAEYAIDSTPLNNALRQGKQLTKEQNQLMRNVDAAISNNAINKNITVYRGVSDVMVQRYVAMGIGKTTLQAGFLSTTKDLDVAKEFGVGLMHIEVPQGRNGIDMAHVYKDMNDPAGPQSEHEVLFGRGQKLEYLGRGDGGALRFRMR